MVLRVCLGCTALFPPGLARCPHCGQEEHVEQGSPADPTALTEEDDVAKISRAGGPTIEGVPGMTNQSDREEDQSAFLADPETGGAPSRADRIEQATADRAAGLDPEQEARRRAGQPTEDDPSQQQGEQDDQQQQQEQQEQQEQGDDQPREQGSYEGLTYNEAQALCKDRRLPATGTHSELVTRLENADRRGLGG